MKQWYTLYTKPNAEYQVATALRQRGLEIFLPEIATTEGNGPQPLFPSYLFFKVDFGITMMSSIQWTPGLIRILAFGDDPQPVDVEVIDLIRRKLAEVKAKGDWLEHDFQPGDTVRITDGPFEDMLAIFEGPTTANQRVQVLLKVLGGSRMQVEVANLEKASPETNTNGKPPTKRPRRTRGRGRRIKNSTQGATSGLHD